MNLLREFQQFDRRCAHLATLANNALAQRNANRTLFETYLCYALIALHDAWAYRCRAIVLRSAIGGVRTISGIVLPPMHRRPMVWLRKHWGRKVMPPTWEPDWYIPATAIRAAQILGTANVNQITNGLGASIAAERVRITRNVVAHSLPATWKRLRTLQRMLGHTGEEPPSEFALLRDRNIGARHIDAWIADLRACIRVAAS